MPEKPDSIAFLECVKELLLKKYPKITTSEGRVGPFPGKTRPEDIKGKADLWITGVKTSASWEFDDESEFEKAGIPGITISLDEYVPQRKRLALVCGLPGLRVVGINTEKFYTVELTREKMMPIAEEAIDAIIAALTSSLTEEEKNPQPVEYDYGDFVFEGDTYTEAYEKFQTYFAENDMSDTLSAAPPTNEAVQKMLAGISRPPDEVLGKMHPYYGVATIEKVAVNAVMAGAKPEYLPVIVAAVEALCDPNFDENHIQIGQATTNALIAVSGPIAKEIGMNSKAAYLGPGTRSNNTIGRAVSLCMINIGGCSPVKEAGWHGSASRFCNMVVAENLEDSPWASYAESIGYTKEDSIVLVDEVMHMDRGPSGAMSAGTLEESIDMLSNMLHGVFPGFKPDDGKLDFMMSIGNSPEDLINRVMCTIVIYPALARQLSAIGYDTREKLLAELCRRKRIPWEALSAKQKDDVIALAKSGRMPTLSIDDCKDGGTVPSVNPKQVAIYVSGPMMGMTLGFYGYGNYNSCMRGYDPSLPGMCSKKVQGATLTVSGR